MLTYQSTKFSWSFHYTQHCYDTSTFSFKEIYALLQEKDLWLKGREGGSIGDVTLFAKAKGKGGTNSKENENKEKTNKNIFKKGNEEKHKEVLVFINDTDVSHYMQ